MSSFADNQRRPSSELRNFSINEEYLNILRTKSNVELFTKARKFIIHIEFSYSSTVMLLQPDEILIPVVLEDLISPKLPSDLKPLLIEYFNTTAEAARVCSQHLRSIHELYSKYKFIRSQLDRFIIDRSANLNSNALLSSSIPPNHLKQICDNFSAMLHQLSLRRNEVERRINQKDCTKNALGNFAIFVYSLRMKKRNLLPKKPRGKLESVEKGAYILNREFDTMSRLAARVCDEVEHNGEMMRFCLDRREEQCFPHLEEMMK